MKLNTNNPDLIGRNGQEVTALGANIVLNEESGGSWVDVRFTDGFEATVSSTDLVA